MPEWDIESEESLIWGQENRVYELEGLERLLTHAVGGGGNKQSPLKIITPQQRPARKRDNHEPDPHYPSP